MTNNPSVDNRAKGTRIAGDPYAGLLQACMGLALERVRSVQNFARNWTDIRFDADYEKRRHLCRFHLEWIMSDEDTGRLTFRDLCQFSQAEDLQDVRVARKAILDMFSKSALESLSQPVNEQLMKLTASRWLHAGCRS